MEKNIIRWLVLIVTAANIIFHLLYTEIPGLYPIPEVTRVYSSLFNPASYTFSIWGLIYLSLLTYSVIQLLPSNRHIKVYDRIAIPLIFVNIFAMLWIYFFVTDNMLLSMAVITLMLLISMILFNFAVDTSEKRDTSIWIQVPFSLLFGWLTLAAIVNLSIWLYAEGFDFAARTPAFIYLLIVIAAMIGFYVSIQKMNFIYPLVISWGLLGIWMARKNNYEEIGFIAFVCGIMMIVSAILTALIKSNIITFSSSSKPSAPSR
jgi:hypothetical protein